MRLVGRLLVVVAIAASQSHWNLLGVHLLGWSRLELDLKRLKFGRLVP
jgi:hypothetical protein